MTCYMPNNIIRVEAVPQAALAAVVVPSPSRSSIALCIIPDARIPDLALRQRDIGKGEAARCHSDAVSFLFTLQEYSFLSSKRPAWGSAEICRRPDR